jgi:hypothetical protein
MSTLMNERLSALGASRMTSDAFLFIKIFIDYFSQLIML